MPRRGRPRELPDNDARRKIFQLTTVQAAWLEAEAREMDQSEAAVIRRLIRRAMEENL